MVLHKKDIVNKIAERTGFRKQDIAVMLTEMKDVMREKLVKGNSVSIRNLFTLTPTIRTGNKYNLISEEVEYKEEYVSVKAIPSKRLRQYVRENSKLTRSKHNMAYMRAKERRLKERKEFKEYIKLADDRVLDTSKVGIDLLSADEIFVQVEETECYWISNWGRLVNNMRKVVEFFY